MFILAVIVTILRLLGNLYGPWVCKVPSYANFDFSEPNIAYDHGQPTNCYEMPVNGFQFVLTYNISAYMSSNMPTAPSGVTYKLSTTGNIPVRDTINSHLQYLNVLCVCSTASKHD